MEPNSGTNSNSMSQWIIFSLLAALTLLSGLVYSLQAPFYPIEAKEKGVSIVEIGFIYGVYELASFLFAPVAGTLMTKIGPVASLYWGIFLTGVGILAVGLLEYVTNTTWFIILSVILRVTQAIGATSRAIAIVSMITFTFQNAIATTFASIESFFGIGVCSGVLIAGYLMELTGFLGTFLILGSVLLLTLPISWLTLRYCEVSKEFGSNGDGSTPPSANSDDSSNNNKKRKFGVFTLMRIPTVALSVFAVVAAAISLGFTMGVLEPHLGQFKLNPVMIGLMFLFRDLAYAVASPVLGCLFDKIKSPYYVRLIGPTLMFVSFSIIGPAPFVPIKPNLWLTALGLSILGIGLSSTLVSSFLFALQDAKKIFASGGDDIRMHELISGIWRSAIALGLFAGPSIAGVLYDAIGFPNESLLILGLQLLHIILIIGCICLKPETKTLLEPGPINSATLETESERTPLLSHVSPPVPAPAHEP